MLRTFGEKALSCRNLADLTHQREAGIPTGWWKLIGVPVSPDIMVVQAGLFSSRRTGIKRELTLSAKPVFNVTWCDKTSQGPSGHTV